MHFTRNIYYTNYKYKENNIFGYIFFCFLGRESALFVFFLFLYIYNLRGNIMQNEKKKK